jgi:hypothetical protein
MTSVSMCVNIVDTPLSGPCADGAVTANTIRNSRRGADAGAI